MERINQKAITIVEALLFGGVIASVIISLFEILSSEFFSPSEIFSLLSLRISIILFVLFITFPYLMTYARSIGEKVMLRFAKKNFEDNFFNELKGREEINIISLANKYHVNLIFVKNYLRNQIAQGLLQGELKRDIFYVAEDFKISDPKEKRMEFMKQNIGKYISSHRSIRLKELSNVFKVPQHALKAYLVNLINKGLFKGFFDGNTLHRDISSSISSKLIANKNKLPDKTINCPYCHKPINLGLLGEKPIKD